MSSWGKQCWQTSATGGCSFWFKTKLIASTRAGSCDGAALSVVTWTTLSLNRVEQQRIMQACQQLQDDQEGYYVMDCLLNKKYKVGTEYHTLGYLFVPCACPSLPCGCDSGFPVLLCVVIHVSIASLSIWFLWYSSASELLLYAPLTSAQLFSASVLHFPVDLAPTACDRITKKKKRWRLNESSPETNQNLSFLVH